MMALQIFINGAARDMTAKEEAEHLVLQTAAPAGLIRAPKTREQMLIDVLIAKQVIAASDVTITEVANARTP